MLMMITDVLTSCSCKERSSSSRMSESTLSDSRSRRNVESLSHWQRSSYWLSLSHHHYTQSHRQTEYY